MPSAQLGITRQRLITLTIGLERPDGQRGVDLLGDLLGLPFVGLRCSDAAVLLLIATPTGADPPRPSIPHHLRCHCYLLLRRKYAVTADRTSEAIL
jgi:hypothetical protein